MGPSCSPFCKHVTDLSEINFNMLNRFLDLKNLCVAAKSMCLAHILKKILRIYLLAVILNAILNISISPMMPRWPHSVSMYGHIGEHIYAKNILCGLFFLVAPKIFIWQPDYFRNGQVIKQCTGYYLSLNKCIAMS